MFSKRILERLTGALLMAGIVVFVRLCLRNHNASTAR